MYIPGHNDKLDNFCDYEIVFVIAHVFSNKICGIIINL